MQQFIHMNIFALSLASVGLSLQIHGAQGTQLLTWKQILLQTMHPGVLKRWVQFNLLRDPVADALGITTKASVALTGVGVAYKWGSHEWQIARTKNEIRTIEHLNRFQDGLMQVNEPNDPLSTAQRCEFRLDRAAKLDDLRQQYKTLKRTECIL